MSTTEDKNDEISAQINDENPSNGIDLSLKTKEAQLIFHNKNVIQEIRHKSEKYQAKIIEKLNEQMTNMIDEILSEVEDKAQFAALSKNTPVSTTSKKKLGDSLPEKEFVIRESLLTDLLEITHIQTIYHIFVAILVILFLQTFLYDLVETGRFGLNYSMIQSSFGKIQLVMAVWCIMKLSIILLVFPVFHFWAHNHLSLKAKGIPNWAFLVLFIGFLSLFLILPARVVLRENIPTASSAIILCEQVRLIMKSYAFVRTNVPRALKFKPHQDSDKEDSVKNSPCPDFGKFLYFLFAPTLIYRDSYPRSATNIRWRYVASNFFQVIACLFYTFYIFQRFCVPVFQRFGHEPFTFRGLLLSVFGCMMPGTLVLLINFFAVLHAWMNAFAEMLRFGDREFYKDWWNSTTYSNYYRTWNVIVHDWLYTYIYKDFYELLKPDRRTPMLIVFFISAVVHEYICSLMFNFFYPILFFLFGCVGMLFILLTNKRKSRTWNIFFWVSLFIGPGILMTLWSTEIYARTNCPPFHDSFLDFFVPRSWVCYRT